MDRAISKGLSKVTTEVIYSSLSIVKDLKASLDVYRLSDVNEFRVTPVFNGIYNHIQSCLETAKA
jgi:hypothetical protein